MATPSVSAIPSVPEAPVSPGEQAALDVEIKLYVQFRNNFEDVERIYKKLKERVDNQRDRLFDVMESQGFKTVNHDLGRFTRTESMRCQVTDVLAARQNLAEEGILDEMTRTEWAQANLNRYVKERLEAGEQPPEGLDIVTDRKITYTRPDEDPRKKKRK